MRAVDSVLRSLTSAAELADPISVLIRVQDTQDASVVTRACALAAQQQALSLSARDTLPPSLEGASPQTIAMARTRLEVGPEATPGSISARAYSADFLPEMGVSKDETLARLAPLLDNSVIRAAWERSQPPDVPIRGDELWASGAVAVTLSVDELAILVEAVPEIVEIHANDRLRVPPVARVANLPDRVLENRASSWGLRTIGALAAWGAYGVRGAGVKVAVLDTGVDATHPDLKDRVKGWAEFDANGAAVVGSHPHDSGTHGTHVAGTIAGGSTSGQWIGVAPEADLYCALVLDGDHGGTHAQIQAGMSWAIEQRVDVISMSLGGLTLGPEMPATYTSAMLKAVQAGIPVVVAIGNDGSQTTGSPGNDLYALSIGATDYLDRVAGFSGGRTQIVNESTYVRKELLPLVYSRPQLSAPGMAIVSSVPGGTWDAYNGTSMATPHVSGAIALLLSATDIRRKVPARERAFTIADLLTGSVEELGEAGQDHRYGFGRLDVLNAIGFALERGY